MPQDPSAVAPRQGSPESGAGKPREITGRHVLIVTVAAFAVIVGVNLTLAWQAVATFPGLEVRNGYVASQSFEAERRAQEALGWTVASRVADGLLTVEVTGGGGRPADVAEISALLGRSTSRAEDQAPDFARSGPGRFEAPVRVARGHWVLQLRATAGDGTAFRQRIAVSVR